MKAKFPVVFVVFCFALYGNHMQVLILYVCVCVCKGGDLLD
jgi:hypothetical protein